MTFGGFSNWPPMAQPAVVQNTGSARESSPTVSAHQPPAVWLHPVGGDLSDFPPRPSASSFPRI